MNRKVKVKDIKELKHLDGVLNFEIVDEEIKSVTVFLCGDEITITKVGDYSSSLSILVNESKVEETTYSVTGKIGGMEIYPMEFGVDKEAAEKFIREKSAEHLDTELFVDETTFFVGKSKIR